MDLTVGQKKWHRVFGWITIERPGDTGILATSQYKHIQHYVMGKGWIDYIGTSPEGFIEHIFIRLNEPGNELFDGVQTDRSQALIGNMIKHLA